MINKSITTIVHVCAYYSPNIGGLERVAQMAAEGLAERKHRVLVLTSNQGIDRNQSNQENTFQIKPLRSFRFVGVAIAPTLIWHLLILPKNSIIHLHLAHAYFSELVLLVSKIRHIPYVVHFHLDVGSSGGLGLFMLYKKIFWGPVIRGAKKVIVCSFDQGKVVQNKYRVINKENIIIIPNAVSSDFFSDRVYTPSTKKLRLLYIGRLSLQKRVERLIELVSRISIPVHLSIVGDGPSRYQLEELSKKITFNNVSFEGKKNDKEMQIYHRNNDLFLISSDKEGGTPLVVLEAMAAGLPVIGTNVSGIRELLQSVGILINEPYAENFVKEIEMLWRTPEKLILLSHQSIEKARQYSWPRFIGQLEEVYKEVLL